MPSTGSRALYWGALGLLTCVAVLGLVNPLLTLGRFVPIDTNEGWNAYFGLTALSGGPLYPPAGSLITNNYPPLSFYIVGAAGRLMGDNIFAGRAIALLSMLFVSWSIYYWLRLTGSQVKIASLGAAVFLAYAVTYGRDYVAMDDPQWLAHALMMAGLLVFWHGAGGLPQQPARTGYVVAASVLMIAAGLTKHLLMPLPLAATIWLFRSRPALVKWVASCAIVTALALGLIWWLYGVAFFDNVLAPREYLKGQAISRTLAAVKCFAPLGGLWLVTLVRGRFSGRIGFVSVYMIIAAVVGIAAAGGAGVDVNCLFDVMIAGSLAAALAVEMLESTPVVGLQPRAAASESHAAGPPGAAVGPHRGLLGPAAALAVALCIAGYAATLAPHELQLITSVGEREKAALEDIKLITSQGHGRAGCQQLTLCYWAKSDFMVDFFYLGQRLKTGNMPASACSTAFSDTGLPLLQLQANLGDHAGVLPDYCDRMIASNYRSVRQSPFGNVVVATAKSALK